MAPTTRSSRTAVSTEPTLSIRECRKAKPSSASFSAKAPNVRRTGSGRAAGGSIPLTGGAGWSKERSWTRVEAATGSGSAWKQTTRAAVASWTAASLAAVSRASGRCSRAP
ncbi:hypothetical protein ACIRG4_17260 [Streptomyces sp. NPDC102395]|uniref:hypothetical protein n=1 Tax=Streptomyces sp. NPDC102395 TaxID=3366168 RepID=UPI00380690D3